MVRATVVIGILGMVLAASAAHAAPSQVTLFGQKYSVTVSKRAVTYKNGYTIGVNGAASPADSNGKACLSFAQGADPSQDRLFVGAPIAQAVETKTADQLYVLTGADPNTGAFTPLTAAATPFFGGKVNGIDGGRPISVLWIRDPDPNVPAGKDRNFAAIMFTGPDAYCLYDQRTMLRNYVDDAVFARVMANEPDATDWGELHPDTNPNWHLGSDSVDENMPRGGFLPLAHGPNGTIVGVSQNADGSNLAIGITDPNKDKWHPVLTDLAKATANATIKMDQSDSATALVQISDTEYWLLTSVGDPGGNNDNASGSEPLFRLKITFPADLTKNALNSIKVEPIAMQDVFQLNLHASDGGIFGMTAGRQRVASGARDLYMTDWQGNLITLTPQ